MTETLEELPSGTEPDSPRDREPEAEPIAPDPAPETPGWRRLRHVGWALFAAQLAFLLVWSTVQYRRFGLTHDFSIYDQAWTLIAHGDFDPFDTIVGFPFWRHHGEFMMWPLGLLGSLWPHGILLLWAQDVAVVGAGALAFGWIRDLASDARRRTGLAVAAAALVVLVADPWVYWSVAFDFHFETVGLPFLVLIARTVHRSPRDRWVWLWVVLAFACGDVVTTFVLGVGVCAVLAGKRWRRTGLLIAVAGLTWSGILAALGADKGSGLAGTYGYLAVAAGMAVPHQLGLPQVVSGILEHPVHAIRVLWSRRTDIYGTWAPTGLVGAFSAWGLPIAILALLENGLAHYVAFVVPGFQNSVVLIFGAVGTASVLLRLAKRRPTWTYACAAAVAINALAWGVVWLPHFADQWLRVSPSAARVLSVADSQIAASNQVIVSQGVSGRFAGREWVNDLQRPKTVPLHTATVWVVLAPNQGIETMSVQQTDALAQEMAALPGSQLVDHGAGVWVFRWSPPEGTKELVVPAHVETVSAWTAAGTAGFPSLKGSWEDWRVTGTGRRGYVVDGDYWREPTGIYRATVSLSSTGPVNVEVWDTSGDTLLARRTVAATHGPLLVSQTVQLLSGQAVAAYAGAGPFRIDPIPPPPGAVLEIRVWTPGGKQVRVSTLQLRRISPAAASASR